MSALQVQNPAAGIDAQVVYEATLDHTVLRACAPCKARGVITPHPRAQGLDRDNCPVCGAPSLAPEVQPTIKAEVDQAAAAVIFGAPHG